jgi:hypothetical protein
VSKINAPVDLTTNPTIFIRCFFPWRSPRRTLAIVLAVVWEHIAAPLDEARAGVGNCLRSSQTTPQVVFSAFCRQGARGSARSHGRREGSDRPRVAARHCLIRGRLMVRRWPLDPAMKVRFLPPERMRGSSRGKALLCKRSIRGFDSRPTLVPFAPEIQLEWITEF